MVITTVEGVVEAAREAELLAAWQRVTADAFPPGLVESTLARAGDGRWRIHTVWESREAVMAMRSSTERPAAIEVFAAAGAPTDISIWDVASHVRP
jgi:heme-degrading monooxygenase HmoA